MIRSAPTVSPASTDASASAKTGTAQRLRPVLWFVLMLLVLLAACDNDSVRFIDVPIVTDLLRYPHASEAFVVDVPGNWAIYPQFNAYYAGLSLSPPDADEPVVRIQVYRPVNALLAPIDTYFIDNYQSQWRDQRDDYTEVSRERITTSQWRIDGIRRTPMGIRPVNTFLIYNSTHTAVIDVYMPAEGISEAVVQRIVDSFTLAGDSKLAPGDDEVLARADRLPAFIETSTVLPDSDGSVYVIGMVRNESTESYRDVRVLAQFYNRAGDLITQAEAPLDLYLLEANSRLPFAIRFGEGLVIDSAVYQVTLIVPADRMTQTSGLVTQTLDIGYAADALQPRYFDGTVRNRDVAGVRDIELVAIGYDEDGSIVGYGRSDADESPLGRDRETTFNYEWLPGIEPIATVQVFAQGWRCDDTC